LGIERKPTRIDGDLVGLIRSEARDQNTTLAVGLARGAVLVQNVDVRGAGIDHRKGVIDAICQKYGATDCRDRTFGLDHAVGAAPRLHDIGIEASERGTIRSPAGVIGGASLAAVQPPAIAARL